jgi:hypothetical protein
MNDAQTYATESPARPAQQRVPDEVHLTAYNAAFSELELGFRWDRPMYEWLCGIDCERTRVARYIEQYHPHLLTAYEADFLSQLIFDKKNDYLRNLGRAAN